ERIGHIDAAAVGGHADRALHLAVTGAADTTPAGVGWGADLKVRRDGAVIDHVIAPGQQKGPVGGEFLDAVVERVGDVDVARLVNGHAVGVVELAAKAAYFAPLVEIVAVGVELLDAIVG